MPFFQVFCFFNQLIRSTFQLEAALLVSSSHHHLKYSPPHTGFWQQEPLKTSPCLYSRNNPRKGVVPVKALSAEGLSVDLLQKNNYPQSAFILHYSSSFSMKSPCSLFIIKNKELFKCELLNPEGNRAIFKRVSSLSCYTGQPASSRGLPGRPKAIAASPQEGIFRKEAPGAETF